MDLRRTDEQVALTEVIEDLVASAASPGRVAAVADGPEHHDTELWQRLTGELGVGGLLVPEVLGGAGAGWREASAVLTELGRRLAPVPYLSSCVLAVTAILASDDRPAAEDLLPAIADGSRIATVALANPVGALGPDAVAVEAHPDSDGWTLHGASGFVTDGPVADLFVVLARIADGLGWFVVEVPVARAHVVPMEVLDATRPLARLELDGSPARRLGDRDGWDVAEAVIDAAAVGQACEQAAAARELLDMTVAHASDRLQFGQPIGSFQAIQHHLADLALLVDEATSAVELATWAAGDTPEQLREAASLAAVVCAEALRRVATEAIQVHGGIGFTWEHVAHRYFRRAHAASVLFGTPAAHRDRVLRAIGV